jgi:hypothetical protein
MTLERPTQEIRRLGRRVVRKWYERREALLALFALITSSIFRSPTHREL